MMLTYDWFRRRIERLKGNLIPKDEQQELDTKGTIFALSQGVDVFQAVLNHPQLCEAFTEFTTVQWCVENVLFYKAVESYREQCRTENTNIRQLAQALSTEYIQMGAALEVNLDFGVRRRVLAEVEEAPSETTFDEAQSCVYKLMESDSFTQWKRTDDFKKALQLVVDPNSSDRGSRSRSRPSVQEENASTAKLKGSTAGEQMELA